MTDRIGIDTQGVADPLEPTRREALIACLVDAERAFASIEHVCGALDATGPVRLQTEALVAYTSLDTLTSLLAIEIRRASRERPADVV